MAKITHGDEIQVFNDWNIDVDQCVMCGKEVDVNGYFFQVHFVGGGSIVHSANRVYVYDGGDMGWWSVGSTCARKFADGVLAEGDQH